MAASALIAAALLACAPDAEPPAPATRDPVIQGSADPAPLPYDTTDYLAATEGTDPDSIVRGLVRGVAVRDSVFLGTRGGARITAVLVRLGPERNPGDGYHRLYEVESSGSRRAARATVLEVLGKVPPGEAGFGAVDLDGDGMREPYVGHWTGGQQGFIAELSLLDPRVRFPYWYMLEGDYGDLESRQGEFQGARPPPPPVRRWMTAQVQRVADDADPEARNPVMIRRFAEMRQWRRDHGWDFRRGPVRVRWNPGPVPRVYEAPCSTRDGDLEWVMDGALWGYDRARDRHVLLRVFSRYNAPNGVVLGVRYVWMGITAPAPGGFGVLAYDRAMRRMEVVPIPGLRPSAWSGCDDGMCSGPSLSLRGGRLYGDSVPLALPDSIASQTEFADTARACTRRPK